MKLIEQHPRPAFVGGETGEGTVGATGDVGAATGAFVGGGAPPNHFPEQEPSQLLLLDWHHVFSGWLHSSYGGHEQQAGSVGAATGASVGGGVGGVTVGGVGTGGGVGLSGRMVISAQFQNCSGFPVPTAPVGSSGYVHILLLPPFAWS